MNALLYFQNQQLQVGHDNLEMILNIVVRFNIHLTCKPIPSIQHALDYIARIHIGLIIKLMEALWKIWKLKFLDIDENTIGNYSLISMSTK
jgi:hypothetical protein